ncbi:MAG: 2-oxo acid dehydrogenase subunit E2 [Anaerolineae bacterium]|nr:2-oxo acid dehydrogenase subunit E2 [Anaerolineae bacterium]
MKQMGYEIRRFSRSRQFVADTLRPAEHKHIIHGLLEVDVTQARQIIREYEARTGEHLSFTMFVITCVGKVVGDDKMLQAYRLGRSKLIIYDDVDVVTLVECTTAKGEKIVRGHVFRAVDKKSYLEINQEMQAIQAEPVRKVWSPRQEKLVSLLSLMPEFARRWFWQYIFSNPHRVHQLGGTVCVTSIGMFGEGGGWGIPVVPNTLTLTLGGITRKPGIVDDRIEPREYLSVTVSFDHDIVDGAPAARFAGQLKQLIESGYGLPQVDLSLA